MVKEARMDPSPAYMGVASLAGECVIAPDRPRPDMAAAAQSPGQAERRSQERPADGKPDQRHRCHARQPEADEPEDALPERSWRILRIRHQ